MDGDKCTYYWIDDEVIHSGTFQYCETLKDEVKVTHVICGDELVEEPKLSWFRFTSQIFMHHSRSWSVCTSNAPERWTVEEAARMVTMVTDVKISCGHYHQHKEQAERD